MNANADVQVMFALFLNRLHLELIVYFVVVRWRQSHYAQCIVLLYCLPYQKYVFLASFIDKYYLIFCTANYHEINLQNLFAKVFYQFVLLFFKAN